MTTGILLPLSGRKYCIRPKGDARGCGE